MKLQQLQENKTGWMKSFLEGFSQDENGSPLPWMTYPAIDFLKKNLNQNHEIFEFGCGASTLFFAKRVKKIVGIETDRMWLEAVRSKLINNQSEELGARPYEGEKSQETFSLTDALLPSGLQTGNVEIHLMEDALIDSAYESFAKNYPKKFDFIIIDSLKRFKCAKNSLTALKPGGAFVLDDSERKNYLKIFDFFSENGFQKQDFPGIAPGQLRMKNTTIFFSA